MKKQSNLTTISLKKSSESLQILLTDNVINKAKHLCNIISKQEWVAFILYYVKDDYYEVFDLVPIAKAQGMQFNIDLSTIENNLNQYIIDKYGFEALELIETGQLHSHVNISTSPSGSGHNRTLQSIETSSDDAADLMHKALNKNEYLSLITNNKNEWSGRCAREVNVSIPSFITKVTYRDIDGQMVTKDVIVPESKEHYIEYNECVFINYSKDILEEDFLQQVDVILKEYDERIKQQNAVRLPKKGNQITTWKNWNEQNSTHSRDLFNQEEVLSSKPVIFNPLFNEEDFEEVSMLIDDEAHFVEFLLGKKSNQSLEVFFQNQCMLNTSFLQSKHGIKVACQFFGITSNNELVLCLIEEIIEMLNTIEIKDCGFINEMYEYYCSQLDLYNTKLV